MPDIDYNSGLIIAFQFLAAALLALPTAWHREANSRIMGIRTFPLVSLGACAYIIVGLQFTGGAESSDAMARIAQGLITGIGFVGGGAILKNEDHVKGTATAASIWITGALGTAVGFQLWWIAILLSLFNFLTLLLLSLLKPKVPTTEE